MMPYYQVSCGTGHRTYKAHDANQVATHLFGECGKDWKWVAKRNLRVLNRITGHNSSYSITQVPKSVYDSVRAKDGNIVGDRMDLTKEPHEQRS